MPSTENARLLETRSIYQLFIRNATLEGTFQAAIGLLEDIAASGFNYVYLTPVHPIGESKRKGSVGSPYAIKDYRAVDPVLGGEDGFRSFLDAAHELGLGVVMDIVYNHTAPDSVLVRDHPDWFYRDSKGSPVPRVEEWSDVVDLDYSHPALVEYQIQTLEEWVRKGVDGFRCDVASLVPLSFWIEARRRITSIRPVLWLAESVHEQFVRTMRRKGIPVWSDTELHAAFDLSYDYDGRAFLEAYWAGTASLSSYLQHVSIQETLYPETARKLRFLENHDQDRSASRFGSNQALQAWTLFAMLLPGTFMAYMGQELAIQKKPSLFEKDPLDRNEGDLAFKNFFVQSMFLTGKLRSKAPVVDIHLLADGVILLTRSCRTENPGEASVSGSTRIAGAALLNLAAKSGQVTLPFPISGFDGFNPTARLELSGSISIPRNLLLLLT